jgi:hypothetical protein
MSAPLNHTVGEWFHTAIVRSGNTFYLFVDGILGNYVTSAQAISDYAAPLEIGRAHPTGGGNFKGYMDEIRITKGAARWTGNFTPPHQAYFTEIAETTGRGLNTFVSSASAPKFRSGELSMKRRYRR